MAVLLGLIIGFLGGMFGIGGSSLSTPMLRLVLGVPPLIALATPLPVTIPTALSGGFNYARRGLVNTRVFVLTSLAGIPGVVLGSWATTVISGRELMLLTAAFVVGVGVRFLTSAWTERSLHPETSSRALSRVASANHRRQPSLLAIVVIGFGVGVFAGLLAIGGGVLLIPAFVFILDLPIREAIATSLIIVAAFALPGSVIHWGLGHIDLGLALQLGIGVIPASYLGAQLSLRLKTWQLEMLFGAFLVAFATYFGWTQWTGI
jgi:uncharacterized membrane protein YfcA